MYWLLKRQVGVGLVSEMRERCLENELMFLN